MRTRFLAPAVVMPLGHQHQPDPMLPTLGSAPYMELTQLEVGGPAGPQHPSPPQTRPKQSSQKILFLPDMGRFGGESSWGSSGPREGPATDGVPAGQPPPHVFP